MKNSFTKILSIVFTVFIGLSCSENINDVPQENLAPETHLFLYPDSGLSQQKSKLRVHWWGDDADGLVIGYFIKWNGIDEEWTFTSSNDSLFALPIGTVDTTFNFQVAAVDNNGNGIYDQSIIVNNINFGAEPFTDKNGNGVYDNGEEFIDLGSIDETPASQNIPIKNTSPEIEWDAQSILPEESFPVMTVGWNTSDLDGDETITQIHLALNDTSDYITLNGNVSLVTLIMNLDTDGPPAFDVYLNGDVDNNSESSLLNLKVEDTNRLFVRAQDNSGATSKFVSLPDTGREWYVKYPAGELLVIDDYESGTSQASFYNDSFNQIYSGNLQNNYDVFDIENTSLPYQNITFVQTIKLFKYIYWYSDSNPSIELASLITQSFLQNGGKIFYSMTFQDSSANFDISLQTLQNFLPIESLGEDKPLTFLFPGANIQNISQYSDIPNMKTATTIGNVRTYTPSSIAASGIYELSSSQISGGISLINNTNNLYFIGLPLDQCNGNSNVNELFEAIFTKFGMSL